MILCSNLLHGGLRCFSSVHCNLLKQLRRTVVFSLLKFPLILTRSTLILFHHSTTDSDTSVYDCSTSHSPLHQSFLFEETPTAAITDVRFKNCIVFVDGANGGFSHLVRSGMYHLFKRKTKVTLHLTKTGVNGKSVCLGIFSSGLIHICHSTE